TAKKIFAVAYSTPSQAVAVGEDGATVISTNADAAAPSFVPVDDQPLSASFARLRAAPGSMVLASGWGGRLARSSDGGRHWRVVSGDQGGWWKAVPPPRKNARYRSVDFVTGKTGFALLESGRLFRTGNRGKSWTELVGTGTARGSDVSFGSARDGWLSVDRVG